jgi:hypothetical protein
MHTFRIVQDQGHWTVELGSGMSSPCKSRAAAIAQAERMAQAIRRHGEAVCVTSDHEYPNAQESAEAPGLARLRALRRLQRAG